MLGRLIYKFNKSAKIQVQGKYRNINYVLARNRQEPPEERSGRGAADWDYLGVVGATIRAGGVVGDGLCADVAEGPEDAGADNLRPHGVRGQALLVPSP